MPEESPFSFGDSIFLLKVHAVLWCLFFSVLLHQASLLVCLFLLLLLVQGVKPQSGDPNGDGKGQKEKEASPTVEGEEELEERFVASSIGEILQFLNMEQTEEEEAEVEVQSEESTAVQDHLFDLAFCFNLASILVFL